MKYVLGFSQPGTVENSFKIIGTLKVWPSSMVPQTYAERMAFYFKWNSCGRESIHPFLCMGPPIVKSLWETLKVM